MVYIYKSLKTASPVHIAFYPFVARFAIIMFLPTRSEKF